MQALNDYLKLRKCGSSFFIGKKEKKTMYTEKHDWILE